jgi:hypothetical protein
MHSIRILEEQNAMKKASEILLSDYKTDSELTVFTKLDFEDFYEAK